MSNLHKMHYSNSKARRYLISSGYNNIYFFPHSRFSKDYIIDGVGFDGVCTYQGTVVFFQVKTNKRISKKELILYRELALKYNIICIWINCEYRNGIKLYR